MFDNLEGRMTQHIGRAMNQVSNTAYAIVDGYDPAVHKARVQFQPSGILSGWLPIKSIWTGNGWGLFAPPTVGDQVVVDFQQGNRESGMVTMRSWNQTNAPLPAVPSGEFWLVHKSGSFIKLTNDGKIALNSASDLNITVSGALNITATGAVNIRGATVNLNPP